MRMISATCKIDDEVYTELKKEMKGYFNSLQGFFTKTVYLYLKDDSFRKIVNEYPLPNLDLFNFIEKNEGQPKKIYKKKKDKVDKVISKLENSVVATTNASTSDSPKPSPSVENSLSNVTESIKKEPQNKKQLSEDTPFSFSLQI